MFGKKINQLEAKRARGKKKKRRRKQTKKFSFRKKCRISEREKTMSKWEFWTTIILVIAACVLLVFSFVVVEPTSSLKSEEQLGNENDDGNGPRLVFVVIDAFRLGFLIDEDSPMNFTRTSITSKSASVFNAYARMPTVTLPRITSYLTGTLPSFGTVLTNLAADELQFDNWVSRIVSSGKKVDFFGDDTWLRLLPGKFARSDGVSSFFVNDFTEVDQNVSRHLNDELAADDWDAMILHFLGLDHIGHSMGGTSPRIPDKLVEMDTVIRRIYERLNGEEKNRRKTCLIVCGDHGMTSAGSHGGASQQESRVPVIIWEINTESRIDSGHELLEEKMTKIEQIDVSATIFDFFELEFPSESYGISLFHDRRLLEKQRTHFARIVKEKNLKTSEICDPCDLDDKFIRNALLRWFREVQMEMIAMSSDVPNASIVICVTLLVLAAILSAEKRIESDHLIILINVICFASSLIEEEHEIWYYLVTSLLVFRAIQMRREEFRRARLLLLFLLMILHRIAMGYVQNSRRRWSMDPNLLPDSYFSDPFDLQVPDLNELLSKNPVATTAISLLAWLIFAGKSNYRSILIFPFISHFLRSQEFVRIDAYFLFAFRILILPISFQISGQLTSGLISLALSVVPTSQLVLLLIINQIGVSSAKLGTGNAENVAFLMAAFFYTGNSNSLSTLSLTSAYVGLLDYSPILVGLQLILNTFAGPLVVLCARKPAVQPHLTFRISCLMTSLIGLYHFQNHLFVWSVYSPKVVYDMAHVVFSASISISNHLIS